MSLKIKIDESGLRKLYIDRGLSSAEIADVYKCEKTAILNRLREYEIPVKQPKLALKPDKQALYNLYINKQLSPYSIAPIFKCDPGTVRNWLLAYNFPIRKKNLIKIPKKQLLNLYFNKRLSLKEIGDLFGYTPSGILGAFRRYRVKLRNSSQSSKYHFLRSDFNGNGSQKSYMIGFRLGDLHVRKSGEIIRIGGGTTKLDQVNLFKNLFNEYGVVYIGNQDKKGAWHPEVGLNKSFIFLLPKHQRIPASIRNSKKLFLHFLAGYTDAEGNIGCYPRGRLKIVSYDYGILKDIGWCLYRFFKVSPVYFLEKTSRVKHNQDALSLILNSRKDLYKILTLLKPLLKHQKRKGDLLSTLKNVKNRLKLAHA